MQIPYAYTACYTYVMLRAHALDNDVSTCHHVVNTIEGSSWPLFIIGNADFKLTTSVLFCLPHINEPYSIVIL